LYEEKHLRLGSIVVIIFLFQINRISKGGYFGELALVTHKPRAASAYAVGNMKLACEYTCPWGISKHGVYYTMSSSNILYKPKFSD